MKKVILVVAVLLALSACSKKPIDTVDSVQNSHEPENFAQNQSNPVTYNDQIFESFIDKCCNLKDQLFSEITASPESENDRSVKTIEEFYNIDLELSVLSMFDEIKFSDTEIKLTQTGDFFKTKSLDLIKFGSIKIYTSEVPSIYLVNDKVYILGEFDQASETLSYESTIERNGMFVKKSKIEICKLDNDYVIRKVNYGSDQDTKVLALSFGAKKLKGAIATTNMRHDDGFTIVGKGHVSIEDMIRGYDKKVEIDFQDGVSVWQ